MEKID
jgi:hypothetical protein